MIWLRRLLALPLVLVSWAIILFVRAAWGQKLWWHNGILVARLSPTSWPSRTWFSRWGGFCCGHGVMLADDADEQVLAHEMVHVEQHEANAIAGLVVGLLFVCATPFTLLATLLVPLFCYLAAMLGAVLNGKSAYRDNHLEAAAYNATKT